MVHVDGRAYHKVKQRVHIAREDIFILQHRFIAFQTKTHRQADQPLVANQTGRVRKGGHQTVPQRIEKDDRKQRQHEQIYAVKRFLSLG